MFTGLVAETGVVRGAERTAAGARLEIEAGLAAELRLGDSVAVSGVCLTATAAGRDAFAVDAVPETLERTTLGRLETGDRVNLELPLRAADRLGGHIVQGHVDGLATVEAVAAEGESRRLSLVADPSVCRYVVMKGSVALDGVSLTVADAGDDGFAVALIPETLERTTLGALRAGYEVNVEVDLLAKYVEKLGMARDAVTAGSGT